MEVDSLIWATLRGNNSSPRLLALTQQPAQGCGSELGAVLYGRPSNRRKWISCAELSAYRRILVQHRVQ
jgi:hypothetical protein